MTEAISCFHKAAISPAAHPKLQFSAAVKWAHLASKYSHSSVLQGYTVLLNIVPQIAWLEPTVTEQYKALDPIGIMATEAAAAAISAKQYNTALELLEQGRAIIWNRIFHLHTPVDALHHKEPILAMEFTCISKALEHVTNYGSSYEDLSIHSNHSAQNYQHLEFTRISKALGRNYGSSYKDLSTHSNQPLSSKQAILNYQHLVNKWEVLVEKI